MSRKIGVQRRLEQGHMRDALHATNVLFDVQPRRRTPSLFLITGPPATDPVRRGFDARHHAFDQVGGVAAGAEFDEDIEAMQRQGFLPFLL